MANKFVTFLDKLGHDALVVLTFGLSVAKEAEPEIDIALNASGLQGVAGLFNQVIALATAAQATTNNTAGTGTQKLAMVVQGVTPEFEAFLAQQGITMNSSQINSWVNLAVNLLMQIPAPSNSSTPVTTSGVTPAAAAT